MYHEGWGPRPVLLSDRLETGPGPEELCGWDLMFTPVKTFYFSGGTVGRNVIWDIALYFFRRFYIAARLLCWNVHQFDCVCLLSWDVNECGDFTNGGCEQLCLNHPGGFNCTCREGYEVRTDDLTKCQRKWDVHFMQKMYLFHSVFPKGLKYNSYTYELFCLSSCVWPHLSKLWCVCGPQQLWLSSRLPRCWLLRYRCEDVRFIKYMNIFIHISLTDREQRGFGEYTY